MLFLNYCIFPASAEALVRCGAYFLGNMCTKHYENPTMLSRVTAKNVGDVFIETQCRKGILTHFLEFIMLVCLYLCTLIKEQFKGSENFVALCANFDNYGNCEMHQS